jgi:hypothetical protein
MQGVILYFIGVYPRLSLVAVEQTAPRQDQRVGDENRRDAENGADGAE